jgi:hypothetical protein
MTVFALDPTDRVLLESWLTPHDDETPDEYAEALSVPTAVAIRIPTEPDDDGR